MRATLGTPNARGLGRHDPPSCLRRSTERPVRLRVDVASAIGPEAMTIRPANAARAIPTTPAAFGLDLSHAGLDVGEIVDPPPPPPPPARTGVAIMEGERVVFTEESNPQTYVKLIASGAVDDSLLEALEDFVKRQRKRLKAPKDEAAN